MNIDDLTKTIHSIKSILEKHKENDKVSRIISSFEELSDCILESCKKGNYATIQKWMMAIHMTGTIAYQ